MQGAQVYVAIRNGELPDWRFVDLCPVCGEHSYTVECQWCGVNIAEEEEKASVEEAKRHIAHCQEWKEYEREHHDSL